MQSTTVYDMTGSRTSGGPGFGAGAFDIERLPLHCHSILRALGVALKADQAALIIQPIDDTQPSVRVGTGVLDEHLPRLQQQPIDEPRINRLADASGWTEERGAASQRSSHLRAILSQGPDFTLIVDVSRAPADNRFDASDIVALQRVAPGLALTMKATMSCMPSSLATDIFHRLPFGVALLDSKRRVVFQNPTMLDIVKRSDGLSVVEGTLHIRPAAAQRALVKSVRQILSVEATRSGLMVWPRNPGQPAYLATAERFHASFASFVMLDKGKPTVRLTVVDPDHSNYNAIAQVAAHFELTPSEIDIVEVMVLGLDVADCAARLNLAINTVRWHQKRIFAKTGTSGRAALILLFVRGSQLYGA